MFTENISSGKYTQCVLIFVVLRKANSWFNYFGIPVGYGDSSHEVRTKINIVGQEL